MSPEICNQCSVCCNKGSCCGGQAGVFFPELCPWSEQYIGIGRWE